MKRYFCYVVLMYIAFIRELGHCGSVSVTFSEVVKRCDHTKKAADNPYSEKRKQTRSSAIAERPRYALRQLKSCCLLHNCTKMPFEKASNR